MLQYRRGRADVGWVLRSLLGPNPRSGIIVRNEILPDLLEEESVLPIALELF